MRVLFAGGGTAGHINPALAIAEHIKRIHPDAVMAFVGTEDGLETNLVPKEGYALHLIDIIGFRKELSLRTLRMLKKMITSQNESKKIIREFHPDIVVGTGGYVCWPVVKVAAKMGIPTLIHEQNAFPGRTIKMLEKYADRVLLSFAGSESYFKYQDKLVITGNPIKEGFVFSKKAAARKQLGVGDEPLIVSFGGSLGARDLNTLIADFIVLHAPRARVRHIHATGAAGWQWMPQLLAKKGITAEKYPWVQVVAYIYNMSTLMAAADVLICRSGAITLSEIAAMGKASILIPSPNVANNHQYYNAKSFADAGAALMLEEKDASAAKLDALVSSLIDHPHRLHEVEQAAQKLAILDSTARIYVQIKQLLEGKDGI